MNPLKQFRRLRAVPDSTPEPSHSAGDERPSLAVVGAGDEIWDDEAGAWVRNVPLRAVTFHLPADALDDAPPDLPAPSARPDDPTPIWDQVMNSRRWASLPRSATLMRLAYEKDGAVATYHQEEMVLSNPPIDTQFEVAALLDIERLDMDAAERAEIVSEAVKAVDHGWGAS